MTHVLTEPVAIVATVVLSRNGWTVTRQAPTFYVSPDVHGFSDLEHAAEVAADVVLSCGQSGDWAHLALSTSDRTHVASFRLDGSRVVLAPIPAIG